jgi:hypothetical protein
MVLRLLLALMVGCTSRRTSMSCCTLKKETFISLRFSPDRWFFCRHQHAQQQQQRFCGQHNEAATAAG